MITNMGLGGFSAAALAFVTWRWRNNQIHRSNVDEKVVAFEKALGSYVGPGRKEIAEAYKVLAPQLKQRTISVKKIKDIFPLYDRVTVISDV